MEAKLAQLGDEVIASFTSKSAAGPLWEALGYALAVAAGRIPAYQSGLSREFFLNRASPNVVKLKAPYTQKFGASAYMELVKTWEAYRKLVAPQIQAEQTEHDVSMARHELNEKSQSVHDIFSNLP